MQLAAFLFNVRIGDVLSLLLLILFILWNYDDLTCVWFALDASFQLESCLLRFLQLLLDPSLLLFVRVLVKSLIAAKQLSRQHGLAIVVLLLLHILVYDDIGWHVEEGAGQ